MARTLLLIRHAKAEREGPTDAERALAERGFRDATAAGQWLAERELLPDLVVVSPARRARQTWTTLQAELPAQPPVEIDGRIYDNTVDDLLDVIHEIADDVTTAALVGHNPAIQELAVTLDDGEGDAGELAVSYPTSGLTVVEVSGRWAGLQPGEARIREFVVPRG